MLNSAGFCKEYPGVCLSGRFGLLWPIGQTELLVISLRRPTASEVRPLRQKTLKTLSGPRGTHKRKPSRRIRGHTLWGRLDPRSVRPPGEGKELKVRPTPSLT